MKLAAAPLLLIISAVFYLSPASEATTFICSAAPRAACQSLVGHVATNATTYGAVKSLYGVKSIRALLSANDLPVSTRSSAAIHGGSTVRVPIPCSCSAGSGVSAGLPVYVVRAGDGLDAIARNVFDGFVTFQEIAAANNISNPDLIQVGQRLLIPLPCSCDPVKGAPVVHYAHLVAPESTVASIGEEFGISQETLLSINRIKDPKTLQAGQVLDVPLRACSSSISNSSLDRNLLVPNGSYALTAQNCVLCSCSANSWTLDCKSIEGISKNSCPAAKCGSQFIGNRSSISACETTTCTYAGYNTSSILTVLANQSTCNGTGLAPSPSQNYSTASRLIIKWMNRPEYVILLTFLFLFGFVV